MRRKNQPDVMLALVVSVLGLDRYGGKERPQLALRADVRIVDVAQQEIEGFYGDRTDFTRFEGIHCGRSVSATTLHQAIYELPVLIDSRGEIGVEDATEIATTLQEITKGLETLRKKHGRARSFGEMVRRLAGVLGSEWVVIDRRTSDNEDKPGKTDAERYVWIDSLVLAGGEIDDRIARWAGLPVQVTGAEDEKAE